MMIILFVLDVYIVVASFHQLCVVHAILRVMLKTYIISIRLQNNDINLEMASTFIFNGAIFSKIYAFSKFPRSSARNLTPNRGAGAVIAAYRRIVRKRHKAALTAGR